MSVAAPILPGRGPRALRRLRRHDRGGVMVEYALSMALFLLLFFALLDFGRLLYNWVMAEKAMQMAARIATVRPAICLEVPETNQRGSASTAEDRFGTPCGSAGSNICAGEGGAVSTVTWPGAGCTVDEDYDTVGEIWEVIEPLMPPGSDPDEHLRFIYTFDPELNFLGGPYVPVVTVEIRDLTFDFVSPILGLAQLAAGQTVTPSEPWEGIPFPSMSVSLPGEDLALGESG